MSKKTEVAYQNIFMYIEENIFQLKPDSFTTDYEIAMRNGIKSVYKNAVMVACWFHYTQALRRKCSKISDFFVNAATNETIDRIFHKFLSLPLLPPNKIKEAYSSLKLAAQCMENREPFDQFLKYYENQWLRKVRNGHILVYKICKSGKYCKYVNVVNMANIVANLIHFRLPFF